MARKRLISPEFFQHGPLFDAEVASGLPLRLAFAGLWCQADREGRFRLRPRELKLGVLPYDEVDFGAVLSALQAYGFIRSYVVDGEAFAYIPSFARWQTFNIKESASTVPAPCQHRADTPGTGTGTGTGLSPSAKPEDPPSNAPPPPGKPPKPARAPKPRAPHPDTWLTPAMRAWEAKFGPKSFVFGLAAKHLSPLLEVLTPDEIGARLERFLRQPDDAKWLTLAKFAQTHGQYAEGVVSAADADLVALAEEARPEAYTNAAAVRAFLAQQATSNPFGARSGLETPFPATGGAPS